MLLSRSALTLIIALISLVATALGGEIHDAVKEGNLDLVKQLIADDVTCVNAGSEAGAMPLHIAAGKGNIAMARLLLDNGAHVEALDGGAFTPVLRACMGNQKEMVELLAHRGANLRAEHPVFGSAITLGYWQECIRGKSGLTDYMMAQGVPFDPNAQVMGVTMLNLASTFKNIEMAKLVIGLGADVNAISDGRGKTELGFAAEAGSAEIVELLIKQGAVVSNNNVDGTPPVLVAVERGFFDIVKLLADAGANLDYVDTSSGRTLLHIATQRGYHNIASELVARGLDVNAVDSYGNTPVFYAGKYGHRKIVAMLTENGAQKPDDMPENFGRPVELESSSGDADAIVRCLLHRGWSIKTKNHFIVVDAEEFRSVRPEEPSLTNGCLLPSELKDQNVVVIYSTYHGRPGEPAFIHEIEDSLTQVLYIQSKLDAWKGCKNTVYVGPGENGTHGGIELFPFMVTESNPALGYFWKVDGVTIFFPGWPPEDFEKFKQDIQGLKDQVGPVDIAFLPAAQSEGDNAVAQFCMEQLKPRVVIPFHTSRRVGPYFRLVDEIAGWGYDVKSFCAENPGDYFVYKAQ